MKKLFPLFCLLLSCLFLVVAGCAPGPNAVAHTPVPGGGVAGFWLGLWQGMIAPFTFLISLFSDGVNVYEVHNNGGWYNFGFILGAGSSLGGGGRVAAPKKR